MDLKAIQAKLKLLRDRIRNQGSISSTDEKELRALIKQSLTHANAELEDISARLKAISEQANDNVAKTKLNDDQKTRLAAFEKTSPVTKSVH